MYLKDICPLMDQGKLLCHTIPWNMSCYIGLAKLYLLLIVTIEVDSFGRPRSHKSNRKSSSSRMNKDCNSSDSIDVSTSDNPREVERTTVYYDPHYNCGLIGFGVVQKIPYQSSTSDYSPIEVNFSSACMRCGMCLAIAEAINQTLIDAHDLMPSNQWFEDNEADIFLRSICDDEFRNYALREVNGERYIGYSMPGAILVVTSVDGNWENRLKKKCHDILNEVGTQELYKHWRDWCAGTTSVLIVDFLCRSESGGLRDCRSIGNGNKPEICENVYRAGIKIRAEFG